MHRVMSENHARKLANAERRKQEAVTQRRLQYQRAREADARPPYHDEDGAEHHKLTCKTCDASFAANDNASYERHVESCAARAEKRKAHFDASIEATREKCRLAEQAAQREVTALETARQGLRTAKERQMKGAQLDKQKRRKKAKEGKPKTKGKKKTEEEDSLYPTRKADETQAPEVTKTALDIAVIKAQERVTEAEKKVKAAQRKADERQHVADMTEARSQGVEEKKLVQKGPGKARQTSKSQKGFLHKMSKEDRASHARVRSEKKRDRRGGGGSKAESQWHASSCSGWHSSRAGKAAAAFADDY